MTPLGFGKELLMPSDSKGKKIVWYSDEINDDFAEMGIKRKPLRQNYRFIHNGIAWKTASFLLYRVIGQPIVFVFTHLISQRFENKDVIREINGSGAYVYANHTNILLDALLPSMLRYRGRSYIVVGPDTMSIKGLNNIVEMLGAIPIGSSLSQKKEMIDCVKTRVRQGNLVIIYPEAHIWPYYTDIRPFVDDSFTYPAHTHTPVYAVTNCYQKRKFGKTPKTVTYVDGPFYPDDSLNVAQRRKKLRDQCYNAMKNRAEENSTYSHIEYRKRES